MATLMVDVPIVVAIADQADIERARRETRRLAMALGFHADDAERVTLAVSELAANLLRYARDGKLLVSAVIGERTGIQLESRDQGPGIGDVDAALVDGFSTGGGLGGGLPGVRRLMDEFTIDTDPSGTRVVVRKWQTNVS